MMKERRLSREIAMQLLYQWELQGTLQRKHETTPEFIANLNLEGFLGHFLHNFYQKDKSLIDTPFILGLIKGTVAAIVKIDHLLDEASFKWKISRMDAIDRAILRLACYELMVKKELSPRVIINEAIEIAKKYGSEQSPAFINGILDSIKP